MTLTVVRAGALTTVQDLGRPGHAHLGVPRSGAADRPALALANRLAGNDAGAAALETTVTGCAVRLGRAAWIAVTGAAGPVRVDGRPAAWGRAVRVPAGAVVDVGPAVHGVRAYLAVGGGIDVPPVLGSRSTDLLSGLGPAPVVDGTTLPLGVPSAPPGPATPSAAGPRDLVLRVTPGPRAEYFPPRAWELLRSAAWEVLPASNRVGVRLGGPVLPRTGGDDLASEGMVPGAIQVPPDGRPVLFLADHPTTGGYPVIGCADPADLPAAAQAAPGRALRFRLVPARWRPPGS